MQLRLTHGALQAQHGVGPGRPSGVSIGGFPRTALPNPACEFPAPGSPHVPSARWSLSAFGQGVGMAAPVSVPRGVYLAGVEQSSAVRGWPPALAEVAAPEVFPSDPAVFPLQPLDHLPPREVGEVAKCLAGYARPEVRAPSPQDPVETDQQDVQRLVRVLSARVLTLAVMAAVPSWPGRCRRSTGRCLACDDAGCAIRGSRGPRRYG